MYEDEGARTRSGRVDEGVRACGGAGEGMRMRLAVRMNEGVRVWRQEGDYASARQCGFDEGGYMMVRA